MPTNHHTKIATFDKYIMSGGDQSLAQIEEICDYGFQMLGVRPDNADQFDEIVIGTIIKLTQNLT